MTHDQIESAKIFLTNRARAYQAVFHPHGVASKDVYDDLKKFCRADESTFHPDARVAAQLDGRREVILRILDHLYLSTDELWLKYGAGVKGVSHVIPDEDV